MAPPRLRNSRTAPLREGRTSKKKDKQPRSGLRYDKRTTSKCKALCDECQRTATSRTELALARAGHRMKLDSECRWSPYTPQGGRRRQTLRPAGGLDEVARPKDTARRRPRPRQRARERHYPVGHSKKDTQSQLGGGRAERATRGMAGTRKKQARGRITSHEQGAGY